MKASTYSPGIATVEIMGITFAMPERKIRELIKILQNVLFELAKSERELKEDHPQ